MIITIVLRLTPFVPGLRLRCDEETEMLGVDDGRLSEFAYGYVDPDAVLDAHLP